MSRINIQVGGHRDTVLITLHTFQQKETLCDVNIQTKDGQVKGHSVILASCASAVLCNQVFTQRNNGMNSIIYINCPQFTRRDVNSVLQFLYLGVINIDTEHVEGFLALCSAWQLQLAASMIEYYLKQNCRNINEAVNCMNLSMQYDSTNQPSTNSQSGVNCMNLSMPYDSTNQLSINSQSRVNSLNLSMPYDSTNQPSTNSQSGVNSMNLSMPYDSTNQPSTNSQSGVNCMNLSMPYDSTNQPSTNSQSGINSNVSASLGVKPNLTVPRLVRSTNGTTQLQTTNSQHLTSNETMVDKGSGSFTYIKPNVSSFTNQVSNDGTLSTKFPQEWSLRLKDGLPSVNGNHETMDQYGKPSGNLLLRSVLEKDGTRLSTNNQVKYSLSDTNLFTDVSQIQTVCHDREQSNILSDTKILVVEPICTEQLSSQSTLDLPNKPLLQLQCEEEEPFVKTEQAYCSGYSSNLPLVHTKGDNCLVNDFTMNAIMLQKNEIQKQAQSILNQTNSSLIDEQFQIVENQFISNRKEQMTVNVTDNWYESSHIFDQIPVNDALNTSNSNQDQAQIIENPYSSNHKEEAQVIQNQNMYIVDGNLASVSNNNISVMNTKDRKNYTKLEEYSKKLKYTENIQKNFIRKRKNTRKTTNGKKDKSVRRKTKNKVEKALCNPTESAMKMDDTSKVSLELTDHSENIDNIELARQIKIRKQKCRKCDYRYTSGDQSYRQHWLENHQNQYQCQDCDWVGPWKRDLAKHMYRKHNETVACPERYPLKKCTFQGCNYTTLSLFMHIHVKGHVKKKQTKRMCEICAATLGCEASLQRHIKLQHSGSKVKACIICAKKFECKMDLKKHMISTHGSPFVCHLCPYKATASYNLDLHLHKKHGIEMKYKKFVCDQCDFYCFRIIQLNQHKLIHTTSTLALEQYKCSKCKKTCKSSVSLRQHIRNVHSSERYKCTLCDYEGKTKIALKRHMTNRHSDERPFGCHLCSYRCKIRENVHSHLKHVHKLKVVTRASMFNNMIKTGKGFDQVQEIDKNGAPLLIMEPEGNSMEALETKGNQDNLDTEGTEY
ncbi:zinc finger Y-chromosomal protein 1-like [Mytilus californianus]|uniref:zinc finger Y-chromosomal protein 1-like n=1 Tax=Mytilus californianus TaxID=6549 RepID=UPI002247702A|nr:zinc finger Y-chromosomal protein 1-like [Mytilus californianus]XP_052085450.1 zinc finger Y-chromosomal protein 1-like [Mytilus californianus]